MVARCRAAGCGPAVEPADLDAVFVDAEANGPRDRKGHAVKRPDETANDGCWNTETKQWRHARRAAVHDHRGTAADERNPAEGCDGHHLPPLARAIFAVDHLAGHLYLRSCLVRAHRTAQAAPSTLGRAV